MSTYQTIVIQTPLATKASLASVCNLAPGQIPAMENLLNYLNGVVSGQYPAQLTIDQGSVAASGTITQTVTGAANGQTLTVAGVTFTAKTSGAGANEWNRSNTVATSATNLAAAINASTGLTGVVTASASLGVVTVTAVIPGVESNGLVQANVDCANTTVVSFAGGSDGTQYVLNFL